MPKNSGLNVRTLKQEIIPNERFDTRINTIGLLLRRKGVIVNLNTIDLCGQQTYLLASNLRLGTYDPSTFEQFRKIPIFLKRQRRRIKRPTTLALFDRDIALIRSLVAETVQRWSHAQETKICLISTLQHLNDFYDSMEFNSLLWQRDDQRELFDQFVALYDEFIDEAMLILDSHTIVSADLKNFFTAGNKLIASANSLDCATAKACRQLEEALLNFEINTILNNG